MKENVLRTAGLQKTTFGQRYKQLHDLSSNIYHAAIFYHDIGTASKTLRQFIDSVKKYILTQTNNVVDSMVEETSTVEIIKNGKSVLSLDKLEFVISQEIESIANAYVVQLSKYGTKKPKQSGKIGVARFETKKQKSKTLDDVVLV